jgi:flagellar FliJ protein
MNSAAATPQMQSLLALLQHDEQRRDQAALRHRQAQGLAERARDQAQQLLAYRVDYEARWSAQFNASATTQILHCYRSFMQRLDQAVTQQSRQVEATEARLAQARGALLDAERRVASVRKLIERRAAELQRAGQRRDQKHADELTLRLRWAAGPHAEPQRADLASG